MTINDENFLTQWSKGEPAALKALVDSYFPVLCRYAQKMLPDESLAKDIVQETFIKLWKYKGTFSTLDGLKGFLYTTTRNGCLNLLRGRAREEARHSKLADTSPSEAEPILNNIVQAESIALLFQAVQTLPEKMREVLMLSFREGLSIREIALQLNTTEKNVRKRKYKALISLRKRLTLTGQPLLILAALLLR